ncbi:MAG: T9SS type A sorting domain-containing protein [Cyclobacteriaceae bacterium]|nr:T9SS type A sorting domain-containing protein [Cyclobacteriaceae bacterium HetDA_MAG_MS6]
MSDIDTIIYVSQTTNDDIIGFAGCESALTPITITIFPEPNRPLSTGNFISATKDQYEFCEAEDITGQTLDISSPDANAVYRWYSDAGLSDLIATGSSIDMTTVNDRTAVDIDANISVVAATSIFVTQTTETASSTGSFTGCESLAQEVEISVNPLPTLAFTGLSSEYCYDDAMIDFGGTSNGASIAGDANATFTITSGATSVTIDNGDGTASFTPADLAIAVGETREGNSNTHTITFDYTDGNGCSFSISTVVTINPQPELDITIGGLSIDVANDNNEYCFDDAAVILRAVANGGNVSSGVTFSGNGLSGFSGGQVTFTPSAAALAASETRLGNQSMHIITLDYEDQVTNCVNTITDTIFVNPHPELEVVFENAAGGNNAGSVVEGSSLCYDEGNFTIRGIADAVNATSGVFTVVNNASGLIDNGDGTATINTSTASQVAQGNNPNSRTGIVTNHTVKYTYIDPTTGCANSIDVSFDIDPQPLLVLNANSTSICVSADMGMANEIIISAVADGNLVTSAGATDYTIDSDGLVVNTGDGTATINTLTAHLAAGGTEVGGNPTTHTVSFSFLDPASGCDNTSQIELTINPLPEISFIGEDLFNVADDNIQICYGETITLIGVTVDGTTDGAPANDGDFEGPGVGVSNDGVATFNSEAARADEPFSPQSSYDVTFTFDDANGCENSITKTILVNPLPDADIQESGGCSGEPVNFEAIVANESDLIGGIVSYTWDFDTRTSEGGVETFPINTVTHTYELNVNQSFDIFPVTVEVETGTGCTYIFGDPTVNVTKSVNVGSSPRAEFTWQGTVVGDTLVISGRDAIGLPTNTLDTVSFTLENIVTNQEVFSGELDITSQVGVVFTDQFNFIPQDPGDYLGTFSVSSTNDCVTSQERIITISPRIMVNEGDTYSEDFDDPTGWVIETVDYSDFDFGPNGLPTGESFYDSAGITPSWVFGTPTATFGASPIDGGAAVFTNNAATGKFYLESEATWVYSPVFDLSNLPRPMLEFEYVNDFDDNNDGVVLQYSTDNGSSWENLGAASSEDGLGSGDNWYNSSVIQGQLSDELVNNQSNGWAGQNGEWKVARHRLDLIGNRSNVRFRFTLGANGSEPGEDAFGFAFDNFRIRTRSKVTLVEQFTSLLDASAMEETKTLIQTILDVDSVNTSDALLITYFTDFLNTNLDNRDPLNQLNSLDPGARVGFYGISSVPRAVLGGDPRFTGTPSGAIAGGVGWSLNDFSRESLSDPKFVIDNITVGGDPDELDVSATFTAISDIPEVNEEGKTTEVSFFYAIIEERIRQSEFEIVGASAGTAPVQADTAALRNVVRKILPNGTGFNEVGAIDSATTFTPSATWKLSDVFDPDELAVIAFVQDDNTGEILQAEIFRDITGKDNQALGVEKLFEAGEPFAVYPNPGNKHFFIELNNPTGEELKWIVHDQSGKTVLNGQIDRFEKTVRIDTREIPSGLYFVQLHNETIKWSPKRIMILHQ